jgi:hypothetical protein
MFGYRVPAPDEAMLISGGKRSGGAPFRVVIGHGAYVMPWFRRVRFLTLAMQESVVQEQCVTTQGIGVNVSAVIASRFPAMSRRSSPPVSDSWVISAKCQLSLARSSPVICVPSSAQ